MNTYREEDDLEEATKIYDDTRKNGLSKVWSTSSSFEAVPPTSFNYLSPPRVNSAFVGSSASIDLTRLPTIEATPTAARPTRRIDFASVSAASGPFIYALGKSPSLSLPPSNSKVDNKPNKFIKTLRGKFYLKLCISILVLILLACIGITIFASIKPCAFTKCHSKASLCINRFPFWGQCVCDAGYSGNGKTVCEECGLSQVATNILRIVGGVNAVPSSWPFAVYIVQTYKGRYNIKGTNYIISNSWSCGGVLINQKTVLTAAHCIHDQTFEYQDEDGEIYTLQMQWNEWYSNVESTLEVYVGVNDIHQINSSNKLGIKKVNRHEEYDEFDFKNDIATIQLHDIVKRSPSIQYACLPYNYSVSYPQLNRRAYIIGWGRTSEVGESSSLLKNSIITVYNSQNCAKVEDKIPKYADAQVCAGALDGSTDTCQGDSGGGLYMREPALTSTLGNNLTVFYVAGIVSYGEGCARKDKPGIYSRTSYYIDWIRKNSDF